MAIARAWLPVAALVGTAAHAADHPSGAEILDQIVVSATLAAQDARTAPASVSIVSRDELQRRAPSNLLDAVRGLPGVSLSPRQVGGRKTFSLRGLEGKHVLVLIDGRRISASDDVIGHSDYQYGWLPIDAIERIEVIRGPMSLLYGSEALGGVINIVTRRPSGEWHGELQSTARALVDGDGGAQTNAHARASGGIGQRIGVSLDASVGSLEPIPDAVDARYDALEGSHLRDMGVALAAELSEQQTLRLDLRQGEEKRDYHDVTRTGTRYRTIYDLDRRHAHLGWDGAFGTTVGQLRLYRSELDIGNRRDHGVAPTRPQALTDTVFDGHVAATLDAHRITVGAELRREYLRNSGLQQGDDTARYRAMFVQDEVSLTDRLMLTGGMRADHHERFGSELSPRAYLVWQASDAWIVKGGFGHAFKAPTLKQISPDYVGAEGPHTFRGNAAIQPETADAFELEVDYAAGPLSWRAAAFETHVDDLITYRLLQQIGPRNIYQYDNVDRARIRGIETGSTYRWRHGLSAAIDLTLLRTRDGTTGAELDYRPEHTVAAHLDWAPDAAWSVRVATERTGPQRAGADTLPSYTLWNASAAWQWSDHSTLRVGLDNVTDVQLAERSSAFGFAERGRSAALTVTVQF